MHSSCVLLSCVLLCACAPREIGRLLEARTTDAREALRRQAAAVDAVRARLSEQLNKRNGELHAMTLKVRGSVAVHIMPGGGCLTYACSARSCKRWQTAAHVTARPQSARWSG